LVTHKYMYQWYITSTLPNIFWYIRYNSSGGTHKLHLFVFSLLFACCFLHYWRVVILRALQATTVVYFLCCVRSSEGISTDFSGFIFC